MSCLLRSPQLLISEVPRLYTCVHMICTPVSMLQTLSFVDCGQLSSEATWLEKYRADNEDSHTMTFELYLTMRELSNLTEHVTDER